MNRFLLVAATLLLYSSVIGCNPNPPRPAGGVRVDNKNRFIEDSLIRIWILSESEIADPPTTKAEAEELESFVTRPLRKFTFNREPGTYFVVASNETRYQSLADNDPFVPGVDFSLLPVDVEEQLVIVGIKNTSPTDLLPKFTEQ